MNLENLYLRKRKLDIAHKKVRLKLINSERKSQFLMRREIVKKPLLKKKIRKNYRKSELKRIPKLGKKTG
jgi:hypothetical protein